MNNNLGEILRQRRFAEGLSLSAVSRRTLIAQRYLEAIEENNWQYLPGDIYIKNFLKRYAEELNLDPFRVLRQYQSSNESVDNSGINSLQKTLPMSKTHFLNVSQLFRNLALSFIGLSLFAYLGWQAYDIFTPPELVINTPANKAITTTSVITVSGRTEEEAEVFINNIQIPVSEGLFSEEIDLQKGVNHLVIRAHTKHSREAVVERTVLWQKEKLSKY